MVLVLVSNASPGSMVGASPHAHAQAKDSVATLNIMLPHEPVGSYRGRSVFLSHVDK
jgi:hypothetical protein